MTVQPPAATAAEPYNYTTFTSSEARGKSTAFRAARSLILDCGARRCARVPILVGSLEVGAPIRNEGRHYHDGHGQRRSAVSQQADTSSPNGKTILLQQDPWLRGVRFPGWARPFLLPWASRLPI
jgi:hypothetical protein